MAYRNTYINNFLTEKDSPLDSSGVKLLDFFEPDSTYRVIAKVKMRKRQKVFDMATKRRYFKNIQGICPAALCCHIAKSYITRLSIPWQKYERIAPEHLFLPFTDYTNGEETYGGGRYIDLTIKDTQWCGDNRFSTNLTILTAPTKKVIGVRYHQKPMPSKPK
ncbi:hypothetical protein MASR1M65_32820 [Saprospiraceae bacterium]